MAVEGTNEKKAVLTAFSKLFRLSTKKYNSVPCTLLNERNRLEEQVWSLPGCVIVYSRLNRTELLVWFVLLYSRRNIKSIKHLPYLYDWITVIPNTSLDNKEAELQEQPTNCEFVRIVNVWWCGEGSQNKKRFEWNNFQENRTSKLKLKMKEWRMSFTMLFFTIKQSQLIEEIRINNFCPLKNDPSFLPLKSLQLYKLKTEL